MHYKANCHFLTILVITQSYQNKTDVHHAGIKTSNVIKSFCLRTVFIAVHVFTRTQKNSQAINASNVHCSQKFGMKILHPK